MTCNFELPHYRELLEAAKAGGYRFTHFGADPQPGDLFLRHDVDLSLAAAVEMAEVEAELGVVTTYLLMTESVFYNLASSEGDAAIARLRELGHAVGLHAVHPNVALDERFDPSSPGTTRSRSTCRTRSRARSTRTGPGTSRRATYRSDSNQHWRSGCPHDDLRAGAFPWLQILVHPEIWVYPGETMGDTMRAMVAAERARRLEQLAADGIDL